MAYQRWNPIHIDWQVLASNSYEHCKFQLACFPWQDPIPKTID